MVYLKKKKSIWRYAAHKLTKLKKFVFLLNNSMFFLLQSWQLQNVLLMGTFPDCDVKLCDLEISRVIVAGQEVRELLGTPDYVCKELNLFCVCLKKK